MQIISNANETVIKILKGFLRTGENYRWLQFCVHAPVEEGILVFNLMTRELVLLSEEEYKNYAQLTYLKEHWFVVSNETKEKEYMDLVRTCLKGLKKNSNTITNYTIFTTTDCNARCFYCFEMGKSRIPMSQETALKVVQYIKKHCGGKSVHISWFGGEPLYNMGVIDTICDGLQEEGICFKSRMTSNGYLFNDEVIDKAKKSWKVKRVQITLDGTEDIYNKIKAFIYKEGSAYKRVLNNIEGLLKASINVSIRMNMDLYNAEDLLALSNELANRFGNNPNLSVYAHHLFKDGVSMAEMHTAEDWDAREKAMERIERKLKESNLDKKNELSNEIRLNHCMADSDNSITILPDGNIGKCEHHTESEFIGHLDHEGFDEARISDWKKRTPEIPECQQCFYYPECIKITKCSNENKCHAHFRSNTLRRVKNDMITTYNKSVSKPKP